jgi:zinc protease
MRSLALILMSLVLTSAAPHAAGKTNIERIITPMGIELWLVRDMSFPMLSFEFAFQGGAAQDPAGKPGVASLVAGLLDEGAGGLDARTFHEQLEERAIGLSFGTARDSLRGSLKTLTENREKAFELLGLSLTAPRFDASEIERIRAAMLAGLRRRTTNPPDIASDTWFARAFPGHPYGHSVHGTLESPPSVTADDLRAYARRVLARSNLKIAVVGAIDGPTVAALVDRTFGDLPAKADLVPVPDVIPQGLGTREIIEIKVPQTVITFGGMGLKRADPDFIPAFVLNHILGGGGFESRLFTEVREKRGLAYSVYSGLTPFEHAGLFIGGVSTRNDRVVEALDIITGEIKRIAIEGPTADELDKAKRYLIGSYPLRFDTSAKIAATLLDVQVDNLGIDYIDNRNELVAAVNAADIRRAASRYLSDLRLLVILVGEPKLTTVHGAAEERVRLP